MNLLPFHMDRKRQGTHYSDRLHRILGACHACGVLWHEEKVTYRNGATEMQRTEDVRSAGRVLVTPQYEKYGLRANPRVLPRLKAMGPQFAYALNVPKAAVEVDGDIVYVRVPRNDGSDGVVTFDAAWAIKPALPAGTILLGVDDDHQQLAVNLLSPSAVHCAVIGMTGSGKTTLLQTMALSCLRSGAHVALLDPVGGFRPLSGHPLVWRGGVFESPGDCAAAMGCLVRRMGQQGDHGDLFVFIDEVPDLVRQSPAIRDALGRIAQAGRHAGLHLILGAQHPLTSELGSATLRNIGVRLVGKVSDPTAAYNAAGMRDSGCEMLQGRGDMIAFLGSRRVPFQAAIADLAAIAAQWPPRTGRVPASQPCVPRAVSPSAPSVPSVASVVQTVQTSPPAHGGGNGRGYDDIPAALVEWIKAQPEPPTPRAVRKWTVQHLGAEFRHRKAVDALTLALGGTPNAPREIAR